MGDSDKAVEASVAALTVTSSNATEHKRAAETEDEPAKRAKPSSGSPGAPPAASAAGAYAEPSAQAPDASQLQQYAGPAQKPVPVEVPTACMDKRICFPYLNHGTCNAGSACRFRHVSADHPDAIADRLRTGHIHRLQTVLPAEKVAELQQQVETGQLTFEKKGICFTYLNKGTCEKGEMCRFRHLAPDHPEAIADRVKMGRYDQLPAHVNPLVDHNPNTARGEQRVCFVYLNKGKCENATCSFRHLMPAHPDAQSVARKRTHVAMGGGGGQFHPGAGMQPLGQQMGWPGAGPGYPLQPGGPPGPSPGQWGAPNPAQQQWEAQQHAQWGAQAAQGAAGAYPGYPPAGQAAGYGGQPGPQPPGGAPPGGHPPWGGADAYGSQMGAPPIGPAIGPQGMGPNAGAPPDPSQPVAQPGSAAAVHAQVQAAQAAAAHVAQQQAAAYGGSGAAAQQQAQQAAAYGGAAAQQQAAAAYGGAAAQQQAAAAYGGGAAQQAAAYGGAAYGGAQQAAAYGGGAQGWGAPAEAPGSHWAGQAGWGGQANAYPNAGAPAAAPHNGPPSTLEPLTFHTNASITGESKLCFPFLNRGYCDKGSSCRFKHVEQSHPDAIADRIRTGHPRRDLQQ